MRPLQLRELNSDAGAEFDRKLALGCGSSGADCHMGLARKTPYRSTAMFPTLPSEAILNAQNIPRRHRYMGLSPGKKLTDIAIDRALHRSCTNARLKIRAAA